MLILLNPSACGGNALRKWKMARDSIQLRNNPYKIHFLNGNFINSRVILSAINKGERKFVAAGGDGTINYLLNFFINNIKPKTLNEITLGTIGVGSSNDFHKPFNHTTKEFIPLKIDFSNVGIRDVGYISIIEGNHTKMKYFLINASIGLTAEANHFFNNPNVFLEWLKKKNTSAAIYYSALKTIISYSAFEATIECPIQGQFKTNLTNIGLVKNPYFSGNLSYNSPINYENGFLNVHLSKNCSWFDAITLLCSLSKKKNGSKKKINSWTTKEVSIRAGNPFHIEYDGEIVMAKSVKFGILTNKIKVCVS